MKKYYFLGCLIGASLLLVAQGPRPGINPALTPGPAGNRQMILNSNSIVAALGYVPGQGGGTDTTNLVRGDLTASQGTNYWIDYAIPSATIISTGDVAFRYSTNWSPNANTSRFSEIFIPATNYLRTLYVFDAATNWNIQSYLLSYALTSGWAHAISARMYGVGETNVSIRIAPLSTPVVRFSPTSVPGLVGWWAYDEAYTDAAATSRATTTGDTVKALKDKSGTGNNLTNAAPSAITYSLTAGPTALPSIVFGGSDYLRSKTVSYTQPNTLFIVFRTVNLGGPNFLFTGDGSARCELDVLTSGTLRQYAGSNPQDTSSGVIVINTYYMVTASFNGSSSYLKVNGTQLVSGTSIGSSKYAQFFLGMDGNTSGSFLNGNVEEVLVYNSNVSGNNVGMIEAYLQTKYSIGH